MRIPAKDGRTRRRCGVALMMLAIGGAASAARAADAPHWYDAVTVHGFASVAADYNFARPSSGVNAFRAYDVHANSFGLDVAELVVARPASSADGAGFRLDLTAGSTLPPATAARGLFRDVDTGVAGNFDVQQAYLSLSGAHDKLHVDAGKFITPVGYEVIEGYDGWNDASSHSFLFTYAEPSTHTGVRAAWTFSPAVSLTGLVANGWDNAVDNNAAKTVGAQFGFTPAGWTIYVGGLLGPEMDHDDGTMRALADVIVQWKPSARVTLGANADWGRDHDVPTGESLRPVVSPVWRGVAAYARVAGSGRLAVSARGEVFRDVFGSRTGVDQTLKEVTLTPECRLSPSCVVRVDVRRDWSDAQAFDDQGVASDHQVTVRGNLVVGF